MSPTKINSNSSENEANTSIIFNQSQTPASLIIEEENEDDMNVFERKYPAPSQDKSKKKIQGLETKFNAYVMATRSVDNDFGNQKNMKIVQNPLENEKKALKRKENNAKYKKMSRFEESQIKRNFLIQS